MSEPTLQERFDFVQDQAKSLREAYKNAYLDSEFITTGDMEHQMDMLPITADIYQAGTTWTAEYPKNMPADVYCALGLSGEVGELVEHVKKIWRNCGGQWDSERRGKIVKEAGDVTYYLSALLLQYGISMSEVFNENQKKLLKRLKEGKIKGEGSNR